MMRNAWFAASLLSLAGILSAQKPFTLSDVPIDRDAAQSAQNYRRVKYEGKVVRVNVRKLVKELTWHKNLDAAIAASKVSKKPVLLVQALGDLKGYV